MAMQQAQRRVTKDLKDFLKSPIPGCHVAIREENALVWDAVIMWNVTSTVTVPFHMVIAFPDTYPTNAPTVGFSCHNFGYNGGASMINI
jgi:ubiquitin-protein ligase